MLQFVALHMYILNNIINEPKSNHKETNILVKLESESWNERLSGQFSPCVSDSHVRLSQKSVFLESAI